MNKFKFNFIDTLIVVLILAIIVVGWLFFNNKTTDATIRFSYDILLREIPVEVINVMEKEADVFDGVKIINIGKISNVSFTEAKRYEFDELEGKYVPTQVPERYDATITVEAEGTRGNVSYFVNDYAVYVGKSVDIKSIGFVGHGVVVGVKEVE